MNFVCENLTEKKGELYFAGQSVKALAEQYGTPLYLMDEDRIRHNCRVYQTAFRDAFGGKGKPFYAGKACAFRGLYRIMQEENMGVDTVSVGEIYTAHSAGFPMENVCFHGNNKTDEDIAYALDKKVGCFVVDNEDELKALQRIAKEKKVRQKILLRITPGIDTHTYEAVNTGKVDSKFGSAIQTGNAEIITRLALDCENIDLAGFHCHVGSQVFGEDVFERTATVMLDFIQEMKEKLGYEAKELDLGGGYGVPYVNTDPKIDIGEKIKSVATVIKKYCQENNISVPYIVMEPGRSIVADAGLTVYTVGSVKTIPGYKTYVSVDGGMADNPRYALYKSRYTLYPVTKMAEEKNTVVTVAGRCCESGDLLQENVPLPQMKRGDLLAVATTGAYNYAMSSHYNRLPNPAVVMLSGGQSRVVVKRETIEQLAQNDL